MGRSVAVQAAEAVRQGVFTGADVLSFALVLGTALSAQVWIRLPFTPVPFTLQVAAVLLAGLTLDPRRAFMVQIAYLTGAAAGIPWLAGMASFSLGLPTLGYLLGFVAAAPVVAALRVRAGPVVAGGIGIGIIHAMGAVYLARVLNLEPSAAILAGVLPFLPGDVLKLAGALTLSRRIRFVPPGT